MCLCMRVYISASTHSCTHTHLLTRRVLSLLPTLTESLGPVPTRQARGAAVTTAATGRSSRSFESSMGAGAPRPQGTLALKGVRPSSVVGPHTRTKTPEAGTFWKQGPPGTCGGFSSRRGCPCRLRMLRALPVCGAQVSTWTGELSQRGSREPLPPHPSAAPNPASPQVHPVITGSSTELVGQAAL